VGNPHPTKSKPCMIGRKHTGSESTRCRERRRRGKQISDAQAVARRRKYNARVRKFWAGEIETPPKKNEN